MYYKLVVIQVYRLVFYKIFNIRIAEQNAAEIAVGLATGRVHFVSTYKNIYIEWQSRLERKFIISITVDNSIKTTKEML